MTSKVLAAEFFGTISLIFTGAGATAGFVYTRLVKSKEPFPPVP